IFSPRLLPSALNTRWSFFSLSWLILSSEIHIVNGTSKSAYFRCCSNRLGKENLFPTYDVLVKGMILDNLRSGWLGLRTPILLTTLGKGGMGLIHSLSL